MRFDDNKDLYEDDAIPLRRRPKKQTPASPVRRPATRPTGTGQPSQTRTAPAQRPAPQRPAAPQRQTASRPSAQARPAQNTPRPVSYARPVQRPVSSGQVRVSQEINRAPGKATHASRDRNKSYSTGKFTIPEQLRNNGAPTRRPDASASASRSAQIPQRGARTPADDIPVAIPVRSRQTTRKMQRNGLPAKKKSAFKKGYLIYLGVLLVLSVIFLIYVHGLLSDFEASQAENVVAAKLEDIKKAASKGRIESEMSLDSIKEKFSPTAEELEAYQKAFSLGDLTYKKSRSGLSSDTETYAFFLNGFHMGNIEIKNVKEEMVLAIFPVTEWEVSSCKAETFSFDFPSSVTISSGGSIVEGKPSENEGLYSYPVSSLFSEDTVITDSAGNTVSFNGKDPVTFANYTVKVLSNLRVYYGDKMIDPAKAELEEIDAYKYIKEYCDEVPDLAVYRLCLIDNGGKVTVKDQSGADVEFKQNETYIEAKDMPKSDTMPEGLFGDPDPLKIAETLNLFTSDDLDGRLHGFNTLAQYLLEGSYFYDKYWEFATGIDMTFVSDHTLDNPIFNSEKVSEYVKFSDDCFSCKIEFIKPMHMANGVYKPDEVNGTYYFVYADDSDDGIDNPHWAVVDNSAEAKQIN